jgi:zinc protease
MRFLFLALGLGLTLAPPAMAKKAALAPSPTTPATVEWTLENGLKVIFVAEHKAPVVTVQVFYDVGAKDEPPEKRGIAHMFEHMMFKGSKRVRPEEHARMLDAVGGSSNAFTSDDLTGYHATVPPAGLELALSLEAERMRNLLLTQSTVDSEREVVKEELRMRLENNPVMKAFDKARELAYTRHPYQELPIGQKQMLDTVTPEDCQKFYDAYYQPGNALLLVVGDVEEPKVRALVQKYFGPLPRAPEPPRPAAALTEPPQKQAREATLTMPVQVPVMIGLYHIPTGASDDMFALEVLQQVLSGGESSRLYQRLVRKDRLAVAAGGFVYALEHPGQFITYAAFLPGVDAAKVRAALDDEIRRVTSEPVDERELVKARNQLATRAAYRKERVTALATQMGSDWVVAHDPKRAFTAAERYDAVSAADVLRVAKAYLQPSNLSLVTLKPAPKGPSAPAAAAPPGGARPAPAVPPATKTKAKAKGGAK